MDHYVSSTRNQYVAAVISTGTLFAGGMSFAWTSPVESQIVADIHGNCSRDFCVSKGEFSWITTCMIFGSLAFGFIAGPLMTAVGRKYALLVYYAALLAGWKVLTFANAVWMLYLGRILVGISFGGSGIIVPIYVGEIAETSIRGKLLSFFEVNLSAGILASYFLGYWLDMFWQSLASTGIVVAIGVGMIFIPESPRYFVSKDRIDDAEKSLKWLRGSNFNPNEEIQGIIEFQRSKVAESMSALFTDPANRRALMIVLGLITGFELSGINGVLFYTANIFEEADIGIDANLAAVFVGVFILCGTITSLFLVDKIGRRILLISSYTVLFLCFITMGIYFQIQLNSPEIAVEWGVLPVVVLCIYVFMNALGATSITFVVMGEIFAQNIKDVAAALSMTCDYTFSIAVSLLFPYVAENAGFGAVFFLFSAFNAITFAFVFIAVPETKGKSFEEIQRLLSRK